MTKLAVSLDDSHDTNWVIYWLWRPPLVVLIKVVLEEMIGESPQAFGGDVKVAQSWEVPLVLHLRWYRSLHANTSSQFAMEEPEIIEHLKAPSCPP